MEIIKNDFQVHPHIFQDAKEMNLAYIGKVEDKKVYTLNICEQKGSDITRFIYSWNDEDNNYYTAAPYYAPVNFGVANSEIMCSYHLNIKKAVNSEFPVEAISKKLKQLTNSSNSKSGFNNDLYRWCKYDHDDNNFTVSNKKSIWDFPFWQPHVYWKEGEIDKENVGKMVQIQGKNKGSQKAHLRFLKN